MLLNFKCPYHAKVMKRFENVSNTMGNQRDSIKLFMPRKMSPPSIAVKRESKSMLHVSKALVAVIVPLILMTLWLYVSMTGMVIYLLLYQIFPQK